MWSRRTLPLYYSAAYVWIYIGILLLTVIGVVSVIVYKRWRKFPRNQQKTFCGNSGYEGDDKSNSWPNTEEDWIELVSQVSSERRYLAPNRSSCFTSDIIKKARGKCLNKTSSHTILLSFHLSHSEISPYLLSNLLPSLLWEDKLVWQCCGGGYFRWNMCFTLLVLSC